jgi:ACS family hexuronate transporter-like MFS transporter
MPDAAYDTQFTSRAPEASHNIRWFVCALLFLATTINYMDRNVFGYVEPLLHNVAFMGWNFAADNHHQPLFDNNFGNILICFQIAYGIGFLLAGRLIDKLGTRTGYALAILVWSAATISHSLVGSVLGFCIARIFLGLGESGNFPAAIKATTEWFPTEERAFATGIFNSGTTAASILTPALVVWVTSRYGWQGAFFITGFLGLAWLVVWLLFPYNRLRSTARQTQTNLVADTAAGGKMPLAQILRRRETYAFALAKGLTDGVWWFYLFYLPQFLNRNYGLTLKAAYWYIVCVYLVSSFGSIAGGGVSGWLMRRGLSVNAGRKLTLLFTALCVVPVVFVPYIGGIFPHNAWPATLLFSLAAAAHQGWSANLYTTSSDMFPSTAVSTVMGIGGGTGAAGGAVFTWVVKHNLSLHPMLVFSMAAGAYLFALLLFQILVPKLGLLQRTVLVSRE